MSMISLLLRENIIFVGRRVFEGRNGLRIIFSLIHQFGQKLIYYAKKQKRPHCKQRPPWNQNRCGYLVVSFIGGQKMGEYLEEACRGGFIIIKQGMGNGQFEVPSKLKQQWAEMLQGEKRYFWNKITLEWFQFIVLSELKSDLHISHLIERSIYPIPKTPKIIILNDKMGEISILAQRRMLTLKAILSQLRLELQLFKIIRDIVTVFQALFKRFGPFAVNERMIAANNHSEVIAWINETFELCQIQNELPKNDHAEQTMLHQILNIIRANSSHELFHDIFISPPSTFAGFLAKINEMIGAERDSLCVFRVAVKNRRIDPPYPLLARNSSNGSQLIKSSEEDQNYEDRVVKRRYGIPKFLKKNKMMNDSQRPADKDGCNQENYHRLMQDDSIREKSGTDKNSSCKYSVGKVRSLNVSPSSKPHSKYTNSFATTNYSQLSHHPYPGTPDGTTLSKISSSKEFKFPSPEDNYSKEQYCVRVHQADSKSGRMLQPSPKKYQKQHNPIKNYSVKTNFKGVVLEKERTGYSYGSLNFHCKLLSQSKELCESRMQEDSQNNQLYLPAESRANEDYSMVIHNELQSFFGVEEELPMEVDIHEEFSRIIY